VEWIVQRSGRSSGSSSSSQLIGIETGACGRARRLNGATPPNTVRTALAQLRFAHCQVGLAVVEEVQPLVKQPYRFLSLGPTARLLHRLNTRFGRAAPHRRRRDWGCCELPRRETEFACHGPTCARGVTGVDQLAAGSALRNQRSRAS
jgi:hypothetical protein